MEWILFVFAWLGLSLLVGHVASKRGRASENWTILALVVSPLIALVVLIAMPQEQAGLVESGEFKKCPMCAETVRAEAKICRFCRADFGAYAAAADAPAQSNAATSVAPAMPPSTVEKHAGVIVGGVALLGLIFLAIALADILK